jgi:hypothetical protein
MSDEDEPMDDPLAFFDGIEPLRETLRGMVAAFVADGFTDQQARKIAVKVLCNEESE